MLWWKQFALEKLGIDGHDDGTQAHQNRTQGRADEDACAEKYACRQRYGHHVVTGGPNEVLDHLSVGGLAEEHQGGNVFGVAVDQDDIGRLGGNVCT